MWVPHVRIHHNYQLQGARRVSKQDLILRIVSTQLQCPQCDSYWLGILPELYTQTHAEARWAALAVPKGFQIRVPTLTRSRGIILGTNLCIEASEGRLGSDRVHSMALAFTSRPWGRSSQNTTQSINLKFQDNWITFQTLIIFLFTASNPKFIFLHLSFSPSLPYPMSKFFGWEWTNCPSWPETVCRTCPSEYRDPASFSFPTSVLKSFTPRRGRKTPGSKGEMVL